MSVLILRSEPWVRGSRYLILAIAPMAIASCGGGGGGGGNSPSANDGIPTIDGISGMFSHGQSIVIVGKFFGAKDHAGPMLWDDFDNAASGSVDGREPLIHQGALSGYSGWNELTVGPGSKPGVVRDASSPKAQSTYHTRSVFVGSSDYWVQALAIFGYPGFKTGNELYISFYYRYTKTSANFGRQTKAWIAYSTASDEAYWSNAFGTCQAGNYWFTYRIEDPDVAETDPNLGAQELSGEWVRFESYLKQSSPGVANGAWHQVVYRPTLGTPKKHVVTLDYYKMRDSSYEWTDWVFGGAYFSDCSPVSVDAMDIDMDEFYLDNTQARVEVCDASTWSARRMCELQLPTAWSDGSITVTFKKGYLPSSTTAYVYVINADGKVNSAGFPVLVAP